MRLAPQATRKLARPRPSHNRAAAEGDGADPVLPHANWLSHVCLAPPDGAILAPGMNIGVLREKDPHDRRVALTPPVVRQLVERGRRSVDGNP